jgi:hypothetical protein
MKRRDRKRGKRELNKRQMKGMEQKRGKSNKMITKGPLSLSVYDFTRIRLYHRSILTVRLIETDDGDSRALRSDQN